LNVPFFGEFSLVIQLQARDQDTCIDPRCEGKTKLWRTKTTIPAGYTERKVVHKFLMKEKNISD